MAPIGSADVQPSTKFGEGPTKIVLGMLQQGDATHLELLETNMQNERSRSWPCKAILVKPPHTTHYVQGLKSREIRSRKITHRGPIFAFFGLF